MKIKLAHQGSFFFSNSETNNLYLRVCPNNQLHSVRGSPFKFGGRCWMCVDCGIEWRASVWKNTVKYYRMNESGNASNDGQLLKFIKLHFFAEAKDLFPAPKKYQVSSYIPAEERTKDDIEQLKFPINEDCI